MSFWRVSRLEAGKCRKGGAPRCEVRALRQLLVERGVAVTHQRDQGPDGEGGADGELENAEEGGHDGDDPAPLGALHQAPCSSERQTCAHHDKEPRKMQHGRPEPLWPEGAVAPGTVSPGTEMAGEERPGEGQTEDTRQHGQPGVDEPHDAERPYLAGVAVQLELEAGDGWSRNHHGTATSGTDWLPRYPSLTRSAAIHWNLPGSWLSHPLRNGRAKGEAPSLFDPRELPTGHSTPARFTTGQYALSQRT